MGLRIEDGKGRGREAAVDGENRLHTHATAHTLEHFISQVKRDAYFVNISAAAPSLTITATGGYVLLLCNTDPKKNLVIHKVFVGTGADDMIMSVVREPVLATLDNEVAATVGNLNFASSRTPAGAFWSWDEANDGITGVSGGTILNTYYFNKGHRVLPFDDAFILGNGDVIGFKFAGAGEMSLGVRFYMLSTDSD